MMVHSDVSTNQIRVGVDPCFSLTISTNIFARARVVHPSGLGEHCSLTESLRSLDPSVEVVLERGVMLPIRSQIPAQHGRLVIAAAAAFAVCVSLTATSGATVAVSPSGANLQNPTQTVWDGVYTEAQATRGRELYLKQCGSCHGENLQGGDESPGLVGGGFLSQWIDLSAGDLLERIRTTMPQDRPGQLSREAYTEILAHLFRANGFPPGQTELPRETAALKQILIATKPEK